MKCKYCGEECGIFRKVHENCETKYNCLFVNLKMASDSIINDEGTSMGWEIFADTIKTPFIKQWLYASSMNLNLHKDESVIWMFENSQYFKVEGAQSQEVIQKIDKGKILLTSKNIYFLGQIKCNKIPYEKILRYEIIQINFLKGIMFQYDTGTTLFLIADEKSKSERDLFLMLFYIINYVNINNLEHLLLKLL